jgi:hypothetical protein
LTCTKEIIDLISLHNRKVTKAQIIDAGFDIIAVANSLSDYYLERFNESH